MKLVPTKVSQNLGRKVLVAKKNSPHIFFAAGVVGVVGSTILACRATLKLEDTLDEIQHDINAVKGLAERKERLNPETYTDRDYHKDLGYVYGKSAAKLGRLYGPAAVVGGISIAALTGSHIQLTRRNTALTATAAALSKAFNEYRDRVREELGEERERDIYLGVEEQTVKDEDGKNQKVKVLKDPNGLSIYARVFDEVSSTRWEKNAEINAIFLKCQQSYLNNLLHARGYVFLNEAYEALGFEHTKAGQVVGWVVDGDGDGYIDFGIYDIYNSRFVAGHEHSVLLDFNVDGVILDLMDTEF